MPPPDRNDFDDSALVVESDLGGTADGESVAENGPLLHEAPDDDARFHPGTPRTCCWRPGMISWTKRPLRAHPVESMESAKRDLAHAWSSRL